MDGGMNGCDGMDGQMDVWIGWMDGAERFTANKLPVHMYQAGFHYCHPNQHLLYRYIIHNQTCLILAE